MMTVKQLINELSKFNPDMIVGVYTEDGEADGFAKIVKEVHCHKRDKGQMKEYYCRGDSYLYNYSQRHPESRFVTIMADTVRCD